MPSLDRSSHANTYLRSLAQLADAPGFRSFQEAEFPAAEDEDGMTRRRWLQLMGASLALAAAGGCRWEKEEILPFAKRPADRIPGEPQRFATAMDLAGSAVGLLVRSVDGRPVKIEGNPRHPYSRGATDAAAQAAILQLYDPDRSQSVYQAAAGNPAVRSWDRFDEFARSHFDALRADRGAGLRILAEADSSPTLAAQHRELIEAFPQAQWHQYEPISRDNERAGAKLAWGRPLRTHFALDKARVIVSIDADLFDSHPAALRHARDFAAGRDVIDGKMNRLYVVESCLSITGAAADHRLPIGCREMAAFVEAVQQEVLARGLPARAEQIGPSPGASSAGGSPPRVERFLRAIVDDLIANGGQSVVVAGPRQPAEVHRAVHVINAALENVGTTVAYTADPEPDRSSHLEAIRSLTAQINAGTVRSLLILGGNPAYNAPADLQFADALETVPDRIHLSLYRNETSRRCTWQLPRAHFLESWGDARAYDGTYNIVQPLIGPLGNGRSAIELLALILGQGPADARQIVRNTFQQVAGEDDWQRRWQAALSEGLLAESQWPSEKPSRNEVARSSPQARWVEERDLRNGDLEIVFCGDASVYDGRFANNGWLQEMPDPMTRLTWDNAALIGPATAKGLGVENETLVKLQHKGREVEMPVCVVPGQAPGCVAVMLGYGRTAAGHVGGLADDGVDPVGVDVYRLRTSDAMEFGTGLAVEPTGRKYALAGTQNRFVIDTVGRKSRAERLDALVREATLGQLDDYRRLSPEAKKETDVAGHHVHHVELESLWQEPQFDGHRWGMTIDLSKCIGCGACVVACQAENNIPVVGKERVLQGRQMHWLRVDRYFRGDPDDPQIACQPVPCQQCELAPCEQVCPVAATVHSKEGLNDQVYNRCVGTRYCANNCPYKVRRFNYFNYHKQFANAANEVKKMVFNPEVTVRSRGVMEKCTYCVQRIQAVKIEAKNARRPIEDGEIQTACQQVCRSGAIRFGDLADGTSAVARARQDDRNYAMLAELNVKPRTTYLTRIRNPNPVIESPENAAPDDRSHGTPPSG